MKIRQDFVTNSSSSSYVIAYKEIPAFDEETLKKYPILSALSDILETLLFAEDDYSYSSTTKGEKITTKEELDAYYKKEWYCGDQTLEEVMADDEYYQEEYNDSLSALNDGDCLIMKTVDDNDSTLTHLIRKLANGNTGIRIIRGD